MNQALLIIAVGNPSRGDDALGPLFLEHLTEWPEPFNDQDKIELLTDFQLQIEHTIDLENRKLVLFVDASVSCRSPFQFSRLQPAKNTGYTSHALSPAVVLQIYGQINPDPPPPAFQLAIRGERFELGDPLSTMAQTNLILALTFASQLLAIPAVKTWDQFVQEYENT
ncbi:MAG: hydrogenase maturation protease [Candidatus Competibacteraceae bacterium]|nr:MAG: hydrogenase maturation protease [Candidatus Competibacteraceae bacterium]